MWDCECYIWIKTKYPWIPKQMLSSMLFQWFSSVWHFAYLSWWIYNSLYRSHNNNPYKQYYLSNLQFSKNPNICPFLSVYPFFKGIQSSLLSNLQSLQNDLILYNFCSSLSMCIYIFFVLRWIWSSLLMPINNRCKKRKCL